MYVLVCNSAENDSGRGPESPFFSVHFRADARYVQDDGPCSLPVHRARKEHSQHRIQTAFLIASIIIALCLPPVTGRLWLRPPSFLRTYVTNASILWSGRLRFPQRQASSSLGLGSGAVLRRVQSNHAICEQCGVVMYPSRTGRWRAEKTRDALVRDSILGEQGHGSPGSSERSSEQAYEAPMME